MHTRRSIFGRLGRILAVMPLVLTVSSRGGVGEALILHQHGAYGAHFHFLGPDDFLINVAFSSTFGHAGRLQSGWRLPMMSAVHQGIRLVAIIPTGLFATSSPRDQASERSFSHQDCAQPIFLSSEGSTAIHPWACLTPKYRSALALLLIRNHILLI